MSHSIHISYDTVLLHFFGEVGGRLGLRGYYHIRENFNFFGGVGQRLEFCNVIASLAVIVFIFFITMKKEGHFSENRRRQSSLRQMQFKSLVLIFDLYHLHLGVFFQL